MPPSEIDAIFATAPATKSKKRKRNQPRPQPETVHDPSAAPPPAKKTKPRADIARFVDSRGSAPRKRTEEGFAIYKEHELRISDGGGDTPLCPFDCQCCQCTTSPPRTC
ncbi:hypothetical protein K488DRAFT_56007 [Vararia minispora EC-137]|uniref:Uncharacterized protein n=1 Tax=Vararia minispora EC-137 TaxID=1314806 RepID=A0ACB8QDE8_9AGAM|nr:hypothetical protein K488DRAFT_56007 [Vararia minispora EC-137]